MNKDKFRRELGGDDEDERDPKKTTARGSLSRKILVQNSRSTKMMNVFCERDGSRHF